MKEILERIKEKLLNTPKEILFGLAVLLFIAFDISNFLYSMDDYKKNPDVVQYNRLSDIIDDDENKSIEHINITELIGNLGKESRVYILKDQVKESNRYNVVAQNEKKTMVAMHIPSLSMAFALEPKLIEKGVEYKWIKKSEKPKTLTSKLFSVQIMSLLVLASLVFILLHTSGIKLFQKNFNVKRPKEIEGDFDDLVGYEDIKNEAKQLLDIISHSDQFAKYGIKETFNILFSGKAGTGKSKFALYLAKELDIPIISSTGSLDEMYVGSGARKIRDLFKEANKLANESKKKSCILFIDEGQNLLRKRGESREKWSDDTPNELLAHLDGVEKEGDNNVIVIIASNFHDHNLEMDEAMLRRFKKKIHFREPNLEERKEILVHYLAKVQYKEEKIDISYLAKNMSGMTPAIIESVVNEAGLMALKDEKQVGTEILLKAFERIVVGQSSREVTHGQEKTREIISIHEMGHFLIEYHRALELADNDLPKAKELTRILKISSESVSQIGALGYALRESDEVSRLQSIDEFEWDIRQLYGGVAAEQTVFGEMGITLGSSDDIEKVTKLLEHMVIKNNVYGNAKINYQILNKKEEKLETVEKKSEELYNESLKIISIHKDLLQALAAHLINEWVMTKDEIFDFIEKFNKKNTTKQTKPMKNKNES